ncbi:hypothetical protein HPP92_000004 [Vanilla planifolia]|uniref:Uncharacterized protein n=1 Tax=Vanilla planifolia TaxID=51239 RepID=A0A835S9D6_VANPL|nr:hypothetical protein HPP92_000004 [Vanilla planifolia]
MLRQLKLKALVYTRYHALRKKPVVLFQKAQEGERLRWMMAPLLNLLLGPLKRLLRKDDHRKKKEARRRRREVGEA